MEAICINLRTRKDKRSAMQKQCGRRKIDISFFEAKPHQNPKRGCLESHLAVIKSAVDAGLKEILILEDDAKFIRPLKLPKYPSNWDMLYLGGNVRHVFNRSNPDWYKMCCWTTHAYIVNLQNAELVADILKAADQELEIDNYYIAKIHSKYNCYMVNPIIAIQNDGYSDIEKKHVSYDFMEKTLEGLSKPDHEVVDGAYTLKLPDIDAADLPNISVVTPTYNHGKLFQMAIRNMDEFDYPKNKIEWVIVDDSTEENEVMMADLARRARDMDINHIRLSEWRTIASKRNLGAYKAKHEIIVHMDDDDYYPSESLLARVKILMKYPEKGCVGCSTVGAYDLMSGASTLISDGELSMSEASMAYRKQFWRDQRFDENVEKGEYMSFINGRFEELIDIPYSFVIYAISHGSNITKRKLSDNLQNTEGRKISFYEMWDEETQLFIDSMKKSISKIT